MAHIIQDLRADLKAMKLRNSSRHKFVPEEAIARVVTKDATRLVLEAAGVEPYYWREIVDHVVSHAPKIFAILTLIGEVDKVRQFLSQGKLYDRRLPFREAVLSEKLGIEHPTKFIDKQWQFLAPVFFLGLLNKSFDDETIFPFIDETEIGRGGFGTVYRLRMQQSHQMFWPGHVREVVRKELSSAEAHKIELRNLSILSQLKHPNVLELLASYTCNNRHNLIFPFADGGTLEDLLTGEHECAALKTHKDCVVALARLSSAVESLHRFTHQKVNLGLIGSHRDLRPKNILVSGSHLVLADFGLSRLRTSSESLGSLFQIGGGDYRAPECQESLGQQFVVRRSSDIWSFGCILVEFATYMILGSDAVKEFRDRRGFIQANWTYRLFHCGPGNPNNAVAAWIAHLEQNVATSGRELLKLAQSMLRMNEHDRPKASEVTAELRRIAISEILPEVELVLERVPSGTESIDLSVEKMRFEAWKQALGVTHLDGDKKRVLNDPIASEWKSGETFEKFVEILNAMEEHLSSSRTVHLKEAAILFPMMRLIDDLHHQLNEDSRQTAHTHLQVSLINATDIASLSELEAENSLFPIDKTLKLQLALKRMVTLAQQGQSAIEHLGVNVNAFKLECAFGQHSLGYLHEAGLRHNVLTEWRYYGRRFAEESVNDELFKRANSLADLMHQKKPDGFRTLSCKGLFHDRDRFAFGLIYQYPDHLSTSPAHCRPESLGDLIKRSLKDVKLQPVLDHKFELAAVLAGAILELHLVDWFHKNLSAENVVFFPTSTSMQDAWFRKPFIIGFDHSRPSDPVAFTEGPNETNRAYHHPAYDGNQRYHAGFDYFSIGLLLLEIGIWQPLQDLIKGFSGEKNALRHYLLKRRVPLLTQYMGNDYRDAVKVCLTGFDDEDKDSSKRATLQLLKFQKHVVGRLNSVSFNIAD